MVVTHPLPLDVLVEHLERLDADAVVAMAEEAIGGGQAVSEFVGSLLLPAWQQLERRSGDGDVDRARIGEATAITRRALACAAAAAGAHGVATNRPPVMVVSSSTNADLLGADVVGELVSAAGWPVDVLSGRFAPEDFVEQLRLRRPAALIITFVETTDLPSAGHAIALAHAEGVPVIVWGPAFGPDTTRSHNLGADAWAPSLEVITSTLETWHAVAPVLVSAPQPPVGYAELRADHAALLIATAKISGGGGDANEWARRTAQSLIDHLGAAVLAGDSRVLTDHLVVERKGLARNQLLDVHLLGLVDALAGALPDRSEPARSYVLACRDDLRQALVSSGRPSRAADGATTVTSRPARNLVAATRPGVVVGGDALPDTAAAGSPGQSFTDVLLLAALACQTPFALVSVPQSGGRWSTLSYGFEQRNGLNDPKLLNFVAARNAPVEIPDLSSFAGLAGSALAAAPHNLRWVYAAPLHDSSGTLLGVVAVMDRWLREGSRREQRAMLAVNRRMVALLSPRRKTVAAPEAAAAPDGWAPRPPQGVPAPVTLIAGGRDRPNGLRRAVALPEGQQLLRSHEVAVLFDVTERTVINWAAAGKLPSLRTIGGHLRFHSEDVLELLAGRSTGQRPAVGH
jgi:excisionase family DNA binding protein